MIYVVGAYAHSGVELAWKVAIGLIFPLACIWFADEMGGYVGPTSSVAITSRTPGWLVRIGGWAVLLVPIFIGIVYALIGTKTQVRGELRVVAEAAMARR